MSAVSQPAPFQVGARLLEFLAEGHPTKLDKLVDAMDLAHDDSGAALLREAVDRLVGMGYLRVFDPAKKRSKGGSLCEITDAGVKLVQEYEGGRLADYLARVWDSESDSSNEPASEPDPQSESGARFKWTSQPDMQVTREARQAIPELKAGQYAAALASFFEGAREECTFGLFGHWGRGKTYLMGITAKLLRKRTDRKWIDVHLSAWEHPSSGELWVHLYEQTVRQILSAGGMSEITLALRVTLLRHGTRCLIPGLLVALLCLIPSQTMAAWVLGGFTVTGAATLFLIVRGFRRAGRQLPPHLVQLARHGEKLGLQSVIGEDLRLLLLAWSPWTDAEERGFGARAKQLVQALGLHSFSTVIVVGLVLAIERLIYLRTGSNLLSAIWACVPLAFLGLLFWDRSFCRAKRVLLVVDDLDRCSPQSVIGVMAAVKLLLSRKDVQARMAAAFLVDEKVLHWSIRQKAKEEGIEEVDEDFLRESVEKILIGHLRLPQLAPGELQTVIESVVGETEATRTAGTLALKRHAPGGQAATAIVVPEGDGGEGDLEQRTDVPRAAERDSEIALAEEEQRDRISREEIEAVTSVAKELANEAFEISAGPRTVRAFWIRYRLARQLAFHLGVDYSAEQLARELIRPKFSQDMPLSDYLESHPELIPIVKQVG